MRRGGTAGGGDDDLRRLGDVDSAAPSFALWELSRLDPATPRSPRALRAFRERFGSRGPNEWELRSPTWGTDESTSSLAALDTMRGVGEDESPRARHEERVVAAEAMTAEIAALVAGDPEVHGQFLAAVRSGRLHLAGRERTKTTIVYLVHEMRLASA